MNSRLLLVAISFIVCLTVVSLVFMSCSDDKKCPVCPDNQVQWVIYDNFNDNVLDTSLWYTAIAYGGQTLETDSQLQVWGHTNSWTGSGLVRSKKARPGWRFDLAETYFDDGPGCQGWHISATDPTYTISVEVLNRVTAGCNPANMGDTAGVYEVRYENDSLGVYKGGNLLRRIYARGITYFYLQFYCDNVYGSSDHCHLFIDDLRGLEYQP